MLSNLDPHTAHELSEASRALEHLRLSGPRNTQRAYAAALRYWCAWHALRFGTRLSLPVAPETVLTFLKDHLGVDPDQDAPPPNPYRGPKDQSQHALPADLDTALVDAGFKQRLGPLPVATVTARLSALSRAHKHYAVDDPAIARANPANDPRVREELKRCRTAATRVPHARRASRPLDRTQFQQLLDTCDEDLAGVRDRAILELAWSTGGRRRSELAAAQIKQVKVSPEGHAFFELPSRPRKTGFDPRGLRTRKPLDHDAAIALHAWLRALQSQGITHGELFRAIRGQDINEGLSGEAIRQIVKRRAALANLDVRRISPQSLRSGYLRDALANDVPLQDVLAMGGYRGLPR